MKNSYTKADFVAFMKGVGLKDRMIKRIFKVKTLSTTEAMLTEQEFKNRIRWMIINHLRHVSTEYNQKVKGVPRDSKKYWRIKNRYTKIAEIKYLRLVGEDFSPPLPNNSN